MSKLFRVGLSGDFDFSTGNDQLSFLDLSILEHPDIEIVQLQSTMTMSRDELQDIDAFLTYFCTVNEDALIGNERLLSVSKMAAGYDNMAVPRMTEMGIAYTNTREAYCDAVATAALTLLLAMETRLQERNRLMRESTEGWWQGHRMFHKGLPGRTLGLIGPGFIGRSFLRLSKPFGMRTIATGGTVRPEIAEAHGFDYVDLDTLIKQSDIIVIACSYWIAIICGGMLIPSIFMKRVLPTRMSLLSIVTVSP